MFIMGIYERNAILIVLLFFNWGVISSIGGSLEEDEYGVKFATDCEVCKLVTKEINERLEAKDSSEVLETGYSIDSKKKKKTKYNKSELRLLEALEETCQGMADYRVHKERQDSTRWAKSMSQTFKTLHGLVNKGVKVELGIPMELWDEPSAEVAQLKTQCEQFLEDHEDIINDWYFGKKNIPLQDTLCPTVLKETQCLIEPYGESIPSESSKSKKGDKSKIEQKKQKQEGQKKTEL